MSMLRFHRFAFAVSIGRGVLKKINQTCFAIILLTFLPLLPSFLFIKMTTYKAENFPALQNDLVLRASRGKFFMGSASLRASY